jgi:hypothetical protein
MPGIFSPDLFRHGSVLHDTVAHLISVLNAGKGMGGKGMKTSEIPLPPIPLLISAAALPHGESLIALKVIRKRHAGQGESETGCQPVSPAPGAFPPAPLPRPHLFWHGSVLHPAVAHLIPVLSAGKGMGGKGMKTSEFLCHPFPCQSLPLHLLMCIMPGIFSPRAEWAFPRAEWTFPRSEFTFPGVVRGSSWLFLPAALWRWGLALSASAFLAQPTF